jgi:sulfoxide reductase catalytic subunit YedY
MANIIKRVDWFLPDSAATPEKAYWSRRNFLKQAAFAGAGVLTASVGGCDKSESAPNPATAVPGTGTKTSVPGKGFPAARNPEFNPKWHITEEKAATTYNNFYEFSLAKDVYKHVDKFVTAPWPIEMTGLVEKPLKLDAMELASMFDLEERVYRLRCVEAWGIVVPWTGFPLSKLIEKVQPRSEAKFVRFVSFNRPEQSPGMAQARSYPWPYHEGLRMDEAMNPLTMLVTGVYGKALPKQHGAPIRLIVPWKYGYKSAKSLVKIEFVAEQPKTFWQTLSPEEYPFESNVNPAKPHPRWSQATERLLDSDDRVKTQLYNGYGSYVASLYSV